MKKFTKEWNNLKEIPKLDEVVELNFEEYGQKYKGIYLVTEITKPLKRGNFLLAYAEVRKIHNLKSLKLSFYNPGDCISLIFDNRPKGQICWGA